MSTPPDISSVQAVLEQTLGYQLIGALISLTIYGITVLQAYLYFSKFHKNDSKGLQTLAVLLWILDTICAILVAHALYVVLVKGWGDVSVLTKAPVTFVLENGITVLVTWIVQLFLAHRIWLVSTRRDYITPTLVVIISAGAFGAGLGRTLLSRADHRFTSKAYVNSLLAILNARTHFQKKPNGHNTTIIVSGIRFDNGISPSGVSVSADIDVRNSDKFPIAEDKDSMK